MNVFECKDKDGITVVCALETWLNHIIAEHPEIKGCEAIIKEAIENPYQVYQDSVHPDIKNIYQPFVLPKPFHQFYLRIGIEYRTGLLGRRRGYVRTAFACQSKRRGDVLIWQKEK
jgi:hypothetical protein